MPSNSPSPTNSELICPITWKPVKELRVPAITNEGITYEFTAIAAWLLTNPRGVGTTEVKIKVIMLNRTIDTSNSTNLTKQEKMSIARHYINLKKHSPPLHIYGVQTLQGIKELIDISFEDISLESLRQIEASLMADAEVIAAEISRPRIDLGDIETGLVNNTEDLAENNQDHMSRLAADSIEIQAFLSDIRDRITQGDELWLSANNLSDVRDHRPQGQAEKELIYALSIAAKAIGFTVLSSLLGAVLPNLAGAHEYHIGEITGASVTGGSILFLTLTSIVLNVKNLNCSQHLAEFLKNAYPDSNAPSCKKLLFALAFNFGFVGLEILSGVLGAALCKFETTSIAQWG